MPKTRRTISSDFKAKIALEAIRGVTTVSQIAAKHKIHPNQITKWKKLAQDNLASLFADGRVKAKKDDTEQVQAELYQTIGQLQFELSWLKKKLPIDE